MKQEYRQYPNSLPSVSTFSRDPSLWGFEKDLVAIEGKGCKVKLSDGRWYTDYVNSLGPNILGYQNKEFNKRIKKQIDKGTVFSFGNNLEKQAADRLVDLLGNRIVGWEPDQLGVRFFSSGTEADMAAVRLARAVGGRGKCHLLRSGYSGWSAEMVSTTPPAWGITPEESTYIHDFAFNDLSIFGQWNEREDVALVMLENPSITPKPNFYNSIRQWCDEHKALLAIDDVVCGWRYALGGSCEYYGIQPDLVTYGKAIGNGIPVSALVGKSEYMNRYGGDQPVYNSGTFGGNALSMAAVNAVLDILTDADISKMWAIGDELLCGLQDVGWNAWGDGVRSVFTFNNDYERAYFMRAMRAHGILMNRPNFINLAHTRQDVRDTLEAATWIKQELDSVTEEELKALVGDRLPRVLFRNR
jgi:glutamate-1-semialdehyde 2,1-aminomutase